MTRPRASITNPNDLAWALARLAGAAAQAGDYDRAEAAARTITNPNDQARFLPVANPHMAATPDRDWPGRGPALCPR